MKPIRPADRAHRLAILDAERAALRGRLAVAYAMAREAGTDAERAGADAAIDRLTAAIGELVERHDALVMAA